MPAIFTEKYRVFLAKTLVAQFAANTTIMYAFMGRVLPWAAPTAPPTPVDNTQDTDYGYWHDMLGAKRVTDIQFVVPRFDWVAHTVFTQYDDQSGTLFSSQYYALDTTTLPFKVYKCLWNNKGAESTVAPSVIGTALNPTQTADGYVWQYMYTINDATGRLFLTSQWMPVVVDPTMQANALANPGKLPIAVPLIITTPGSGYNPGINTTVTLVGDGTNANITSNSVHIVGGALDSVVFNVGGNNYTELSVNVYQSGVVQGSVRPIIPPYPNHAYDPVKELNATAIMMVTSFANNETNKLTVSNDYRQIGLIVNPLLANGAPATATYYKQTTDVTFSANTGIFNPDDAVVNKTNPAAPYATVVDVVSNTVMRLTSVHTNGVATPFANGDVLKCYASGAEATVASVSAPELKPYSGDIVLVMNRTAITRGAIQTEQIKLIFPFNADA